jgi:hypothetical protein
MLAVQPPDALPGRPSKPWMRERRRAIGERSKGQQATVEPDDRPRRRRRSGPRGGFKLPPRARLGQAHQECRPFTYCSDNEHRARGMATGQLRWIVPSPLSTTPMIVLGRPARCKA